MVYHSNVKLITTKEGRDMIDKAVREALHITPADNDTLWYLTCKAVWIPLCEGKYLLAEWNDIRWLDSSAEVIALMNELDKLFQVHIPYEFLRVGEDWNDMEHLTDIPDDHQYDDMPSLTLKREIAVEYKG